MSYARYGTPHGEAGYDVEDVCREDGCEAEIDRGLSYLCGLRPGVTTDDACGWWFCRDHLENTPLGDRCPACLAALG